MEAPQPPLPIGRRLLLTIGGSVGSTAIIGLMLFLVAGRVDLPAYWAYLAVTLVIAGVGCWWIDPGLMRERMRPAPGGRDAAFVQIAKILLTAHLVVAALDVGRFHFSDRVPPVLQGLGLAGFAAGWGLAVWAMVTNRFFSPVVRLQSERDHHVVTSGPYRFVRHPGYAGMLVGMLGSGLTLDSWWSLAPVVPAGALTLRRVVLEDRFLHEQLAGYREYARRVRWRLMRGVW